MLNRQIVFVARPTGAVGLEHFRLQESQTPPVGDGEVLVKGIGVFKGYHANETATARAFVDGFFRTGDLGELDPEGFLTITGRK